MKRTLSAAQYQEAIAWYKVFQSVRRQRLAALRLSGNRGRRQTKLFSEFVFREYKSSDKLFVLGSGASINEIEVPMWAEITQHDTFAFNNWYFHEHIPTYYMVEIPAGDLGETVLQNLSITSERYARVPKFIKQHLVGQPVDLSSFPSSFLRNAYYGETLHLHADTIANYGDFLRKLSLFGYNQRSQTFKQPLWTRASLMLALNFAVQAGYSTVVLCGVDLTNTNYFYQAEKYQDREFVKLPVYQTGLVHKTLDPYYYPLTIDQLIYTYREVVLDRHGIDLYVLNDSSALYPALEKYESLHR